MMPPPEAALVALVAVVLFGFLWREEMKDRRYRDVRPADLYRRAAMEDKEG